MIELVEVKNMTDDKIEEYNLVKEDIMYECLLDNKKIGYAIIRNDEKNKLFLVIDRDYQNKGYGNKIFKLLLSKVTGQVICSVPFENTKMIRIIENNSGIEIGRNGISIFYKIN